jgi:ATP-binding cassette subfamily F protein uup
MSTILTATEITVSYGDRTVLDAATLAIDEGDRIGLVGRNGCGKTTFLRILAGLQSPDSGDVSRRRELVVSYLPQDFMLDPAKNVLENIRDGAKPVLNLIAEFESLPHDSKRHEELEHRIAVLEGWSLDRRIETAMSHLNCPAGDRRIETLSGGEKRRVAMCRALVSDPDLLILDEPTNDLDLPTLRVLEEALIAFPGTVLVVSHDRYFLNRVCTDVLAFEGDGKIHHSVGDYDYYLEKKQRQTVAASRESAAIVSLNKSSALSRDAATKATKATKPAKPRKLSFKEARELEGMEAQIHAVDAEIARIEGLFASPDFHRTHATQTNQLTADLAAAKENLAKLYARWEELEAIKAAAEKQ